MDLDQAARKLLAGRDQAALHRLAESPEAAHLASRFDGAAVEKAFREGDEASLAALMRSILATPEGRRLAGEVQKAVDGHGR